MSGVLNSIWDHIILIGSKLMPFLPSLETIGLIGGIIGIPAALFAIFGYQGIISSIEKYWKKQSLLSTKQETLTTDTTTISPSELLQAKHQVVKYIDIHDLQHNLLNWSEGRGETRTSKGRLYTGAGGLGKTRLIIEVAQKLRNENWNAGFLETEIYNDPDKKALLEKRIINGKRKLFIALDYAENRQDEITWLASLAQQRKGTKPFRLALLARAAGEWWQSQCRENGNTNTLFGKGLNEQDHVNIPEEMRPEKRAELFEQALSNYRKKLNSKEVIETQIKPSEELLKHIQIHENYERPLAILMEALLLALNETVEISDGKQGLAPLLSRIIGQEQRHWKEIIGETLNRKHLTRAVQQITLVGGVNSLSEARTLLSHDPLYKDEPKDTLETTLQHLLRLYSEGKKINGLEPDLIGEHLLLQEENHETIINTALIDATLNWLQTQPDKSKQQTLITVLQRATRKDHSPEVSVAGSILEYLIKHKIQDDRIGKKIADDIIAIAISTAEIQGELISILEMCLEELDFRALQNIKLALPSSPEGTLSLRKVWEILSRRIIAYLDKPVVEMSILEKKKYADNLIYFGLSQSALGHRGKALSLTEKAVEIYRYLAGEHSQIFLADLAMSLNNLGNCFNTLGRNSEALIIAQEVEKIYSVMAKSDPDRFLSNHAMSLNNLGNRYESLGQHEEALVTTKEAVGLYHKTLEISPKASNRDLAMSYCNLGHRFGAVGNKEEALKATQKAVKMTRELAEKSSDTFLPDLALSLCDLGVRYEAVGQSHNAFSASEEAVLIFRSLSDVHPNAFLPDLAMTLNNMSVVLISLKRNKEALIVAQEALKTLLPFLAKHPRAFAKEAHKYLNNYYDICAQNNIHPDEVLVHDTRIGIEKAKSEADNPDIREAG